MVSLMVRRTERIWLKPSFNLMQYCHKSKDLYNQANYIFKKQLQLHYFTSSFELMDISTENITLKDYPPNNLIHMIAERNTRLDRAHQHPYTPLKAKLKKHRKPAPALGSADLAQNKKTRNILPFFNETYMDILNGCASL